MQPHRANTILVLGILSLVLCQPLGIAAWVMANEDLQKMSSGTMDPEGLETTKIGKILGIIAVALMAVGLVVSVIFIALFGLSFAALPSAAQ